MFLYVSIYLKWDLQSPCTGGTQYKYSLALVLGLPDIFLVEMMVANVKKKSKQIVISANNRPTRLCLGFSEAPQINKKFISVQHQELPELLRSVMMQHLQRQCQRLEPQQRSKVRKAEVP